VIMASADLSIVYRPLAELIPYARNARTHSDVQVAQIAASIREFGWTNPVLIDPEGGIIAGHGRVMAARKLALTTVPTITLPHLTEAQRRAYVLADNQLALNAGWDIDMLQIELSDLNEMNFDLSLTGFSVDEIDRLLAPAGSEGLTDPDETPEAPAQPVSVLGDVWLLGSHRLVCGDSTSADDVAKALNGVTPHLMVTDPPYGVNIDLTMRDESEARIGRAATRAKGDVLNDDRADWADAWSLFPGSVAYVWHAMRTAGVVFTSLERCGFEIRAEIVWTKERAAVGWGRYAAQHESCFYAVSKSASLARYKGSAESTVWQIPHRKNETGHSTQKPVEAMKRPIEHNSSPGQAVYEPFSGSGTTIIAAEMTGRSCHALELHAPHVDVAVQRWQAFTGKQATLESTGETFAEVAGQRGRSVATTQESITDEIKPKRKKRAAA
jgi:DNA modification methylase